LLEVVALSQGLALILNHSIVLILSKGAEALIVVFEFVVLGFVADQGQVV
jgi:hypothetical protein